MDSPLLIQGKNTRGTIYRRSLPQLNLISRTITLPPNLINRNFAIEPVIWPTNIKPIRQPLPYLNYPISQVNTVLPKPITIRSPRKNKIVKIIGANNQDEIDKMAEMADQSGSGEKEINIVIGPPPQSPSSGPPSTTHECTICFGEKVSRKDFIKCCKKPMCSTCTGRLAKPFCPFCRKPLEGVEEEVVEKIKKVHQQELIKTRMTENFFDKMGADIARLAMLLSREGQTQRILQLFTSVAALKYDNSIPETHQERQVLIDILILKLVPFNSADVPNNVMEIDIGGTIIALTSEVQEEEAIKQSKELI
uniref:Putative RING finger E3 ubiquitin ligase n=1 Tax=Pithovirus LCPAC202 TaxID=2506592 RepID=A0A481Z7I1_9VIRU|nr:MAG: putative RING finger E3 ubiquitin ligase [Pithovirus LCPAC202]